MTKYLTTYLTILLYGCLVAGDPMLLSEPMINEVSRIFRALGDEPRLRLLRILLEADQPLSQKALAEGAGLSKANTSKHLVHLANCGLVTRVQQGQHVLFSPVHSLVAGVSRIVCAQVAQRIRTSFESIV